MKNFENISEHIRKRKKIKARNKVIYEWTLGILGLTVVFTFILIIALMLWIQKMGD